MGSPWAYKLDYDKEIANDEAQIRYLSSDFAIRIAALTEKLLAEGHERVWDWCLDSLIYVVPEAAEIAGLSQEQARQLLFAADCSDTVYTAVCERYGPMQPQDYRAGQALWNSASPEPETKWLDWHPLREEGPRGRKERLKKARAALSRHRRNAEKFGRK